MYGDSFEFSQEILVGIAKGQLLYALFQKLGVHKDKWINSLTRIQKERYFKEPHKTACDMLLVELKEKKE
jgi:hypothetical protein